MAGYLGFLPEWSNFEIDARAICVREGVEVLHAKEFYDTKGDFAGWSRDRKQKFVRDIHDISLGRLELGISFSVEKSKFVNAKREHRVAHSESAFGFGFRSIAYGPHVRCGGFRSPQKGRKPHLRIGKRRCKRRGCAPNIKMD
jgi:hypothetical protein